MYAYLEQVKSALGITGTELDNALNQYANECIEYMRDAGVASSVALGKRAIGTITRGISDLWNYGSGSTGLSPYFKERVIQLSYISGDDPETGGDHEPCVEPMTEQEIEILYKE